MTPLLLLAGMMTSCIAVEGERVTAQDLARADGSFALLSPDTVFGYSPAPGARRILNLAELKRLASLHELSLEPSADICVARPLEPLDPERVIASMRASLGNPEARIEVVELTAFGGPRGELEFSLTGLRAPPLRAPGSPVLWKGFVRYAERRRYPIWARVRISVTSARVVAEEDLRAGQPIEAGQVRLETSDIFPTAEPTAASLDEVLGRVPRRAIPAGTAVPRKLLQAAPDVQRGDEVQVRATSGNAQVQVAGRAQSSGSRGETVLVRNTVSRRSIRARVEGRGLLSTEVNK